MIATPLTVPNQPFQGLDLLHTAVIVLDGQMTIRFVNTATESLLAMARKHLLGLSLDTLARHSDKLVEATRAALHQDLGFIELEWTLSKRGEPSVISCTGTPINGEFQGILLELRPISQRRRLDREEKILEDQQTNRELLRNLAHEIRNPLGGIRGAAQLLENELASADLKEYTQVIRTETLRLQNLMDRMLSSRPSRQIDTLNIHEVLEQVRLLVLAEYPSNLHLQRDYDPSLPDLRGDREQLVQAILNIVRNAAQALEGQGTIWLQSRPVRLITLARRHYRLGIRLSIKDNGPGIPEALQKRIFQPLVSGREEGSGLGLMLAQNLISQHQGLVEFDSQPGNTCFTLILPLLQTELTEKLQTE